MTTTEYSTVLELDGTPDTSIGASGASTRVRGGGYGAEAWLAQIVGLDAKFGFSRNFIQAHKSLSGSGRSGKITWGPLEDGVYEWRGFCVGSTAINWESSGFAAIENGLIARISKAEAEALAAQA